MVYRSDVNAAIIFLCLFVRITVEYGFERSVIQSYFTFEEESNKRFSDREKRFTSVTGLCAFLMFILKIYANRV